MGLVWVACAVVLDVNASYGPCHAHYIEVLVTKNKFPGVRAHPSSISLLSQPADARSPLSVCSYAVPHVIENARGPTEPAHLSPRRAGDEKQIQ